MTEPTALPFAPTVDDGVATIRIDDVTLWTAAAAGALEREVVALEARSDVRAVVVGSLGPAGFDAALDAADAGASERFDALLETIAVGSRRLSVAIAGAARGPGMALVAAADGVFTGADATLGPVGGTSATTLATTRARLRTKLDDDADLYDAETPVTALDAYASGLTDGILTRDLLADAAIFARREAALPRGRYLALERSPSDADTTSEEDHGFQL